MGHDLRAGDGRRAHIRRAALRSQGGDARASGRLWGLSSAAGPALPQTWLSRLLLAALCYAGACPLAACSPVPDPSVGCSEDSQCQGGRCVAGVCVLDADGLGGARQDGAELDGADLQDGTGTVDSFQAACETLADCEKAFSALTACVELRCLEGNCAAAPLPDAVTCLTAAVCPARGVCHAGSCLGKFAPCDDGNPCTADQCLNSGCNHVAFGGGVACPDDGFPCTDDICKSGTCAHPLRQGRCLVDGICANDGEQVAGHCWVCDTANPSTWGLLQSGPCSDGDACTSGDGCQGSGDCIGEPQDCDDANPCTSDGCEPNKGCVHLPIASTCVDNDPCTSESYCEGGLCLASQIITCDDANPCTIDSCQLGLGCVHAPKDGACLADADLCTDDLCIAGKCVAVPSVTICKINGNCVPAGSTSDANPCLVCAPNLQAKAWTVLDAINCNDDNACTSLDTCQNGACKGAVIKCNDASPCTLDGCSAATGCTFTPILGTCSDNSECTIADTCVQGACKGSALGPGDCLDGNPCTTDWCDDYVGCTHAPSLAACDDGDLCTKGDFCNGGACLPGTIVCPCEFNSDCDDGNTCTIDSCKVGVGCSNAPLAAGADCDDGDACTLQDTCTNAICQGKKASCDDSNPCTTDVCLASYGCLHKPLQGQPCNDQNACTKADVCVDGKCKGVSLLCDDGNDCTLDTCASQTGKCEIKVQPDGANCLSDGIPCTLDQCLGGACNHAETQAGFCLISGACISGGASHPGKPCHGCLPGANVNDWTLLVGAVCDDGNACTDVATCTSAGVCQGGPLDCDDGDACTVDGCNPLVLGKDPCLHGPKSGSCDDGNACTLGDTCKGGWCKGETLNCDDGNPCTADACSVSSGCYVFDLPTGSPCQEDGLSCTTDACVEGACKHVLLASACLIAGSCAKAGELAGAAPCLGCVPGQSQVQWSAINGVACNDGDLCTGADVCLGGVCSGVAAKACDDGNPCTEDSCGGGKACSHVATDAPCSDNDPCTQGDQCKAGSCEAGAPVVCAQPKDGSCKSAICVSTAGGCTLVESCPAYHSCLSGLCVTANGGKPGPVAVQMPGAVQPLRPTLAWQEVHSGGLGSLPQLWLAAQDGPCKVEQGQSSSVLAIRLPIGGSAPQVQPLPLVTPGGEAAWCQTHPVWMSHPSSYDALVLAVLEGGQGQGSCGIDARGGRLRLLLAGVGGNGISAGAAPPCPDGPPMPLPWRPDLRLRQSGSASGPPSLSKLHGLLVRATAAGSQRWFGEAATALGGQGAAPPAVVIAGAVEVEVAVRGAVTPWIAGGVFWAPTRHLGPNGGIASLVAWPIDSLGVPADKRNAVLQGAAVAGDIRYDAVDAVFDPDAAKVAVLISGVAADVGKDRAFLAFARVRPDQPLTSGPSMLVVADLPGGLPPKAIDAFRLARLPAAKGYLAVWVPPGGVALHAAKITASSDFAFAAQNLGVLSDAFASHSPGVGADTYGGLSELIVDPTGTRYSLAFEGIGKLWLLTAPLP